MMLKYRELAEMPADKVFYIDGRPEMCHATGFEICDGEPEDQAAWWNEYQDSKNNYHYGR